MGDLLIDWSWGRAVHISLISGLKDLTFPLPFEIGRS